MTQFVVRQSTDGYDLDPVTVLEGSYEEARIEFDKPPEFGLTVHNPSGIEMYRLAGGKEVEIRRNGALGMVGIIDLPDGQQTRAMSKVALQGIHKGYAMLQAFECQDWSFAESFSGSNIRNVKNAVVVNPWDWFIFRAPNGTLGVDNRPPAVDGVAFEDAFRCLIGTRAVWQMDFQDNGFFMPSQINAETNTLQVFRDGPQTQTRPALQRVRNGATLKTGVAIESIPWQQNSPDCSTMGTVSTVAVTFYGKRDAAANNITVDVCRNASAGLGSRTYTNVPLVFTADSPIAGIDKWTGSITLTGAEATKNSLGFRINVAGGATATGTYVYYGRIMATVTSETGISEGSIATYANPTTFLGGGHNVIETNVQGENRIVAIEKIRRQTVSDSAVNPNPNWDCWVDNSLVFHFSQRRGSTIAKTYSFPEGNLREISHEYDLTDIRYQTVAIGAGSGSASNAIKTKADTSLYTLANDWTVNPPGTYGRRARQRSFIDSGETSMVTLYRRAQADHKLHKVPIERIKIRITAEYLQFFATGDTISIDNVNTRTAAGCRVVYVKRSWNGKTKERIDVTLGQPEVTDVDRNANSNRGALEQVIRIIPGDMPQGLAGNGIFFDKDHYGVYAFNVPEGLQVERVMLRLGTLPWQATSKSAAGGGGSVVTSASGGGAIVTSASGGGSVQTSSDDTNNFYPATYSNGTTAGARANNTDISATATVPTTASHGRVIKCLVANTSGTPLMGVLRLVNTTTGATYHEWSIDSASNGCSFVAAWAFEPIHSGGTPHNIQATFFIRGAPATYNYSIQCLVSAVSPHQHEVTIPAHTHGVTIPNHVHDVTIPAHGHALLFGIFQFNSDSDTTGTAAPTYGTNIRLAVDPTVDANGIPTAFTTERHPQVFGGSQTAPQDMDIDITGYLAAEANGVIKSGIHKVYLLGAADSSVRANSLGLSVVSVTPQMTFRGEG